MGQRKSFIALFSTIFHFLQSNTFIFSLSLQMISHSILKAVYSCIRNSQAKYLNTFLSPQTYLGIETLKLTFPGNLQNPDSVAQHLLPDEKNIDFQSVLPTVTSACFSPTVAYGAVVSTYQDLRVSHLFFTGGAIRAFCLCSVSLPSPCSSKAATDRGRSLFFYPESCSLTVSQ